MVTLLCIMCMVVFFGILRWLPGPSFSCLATVAGILPYGVLFLLFLPHLQNKCCTRFSKWPILVLFLMTGVRVGEAKHPGPDQTVSRRPSTFSLGCFNPSGLAGKAQVINEYLGDVDIWSISETHLTTKSLSSFRRGLVTSKSHFRYLTAGYPVPVRAHSQTSGTWELLFCPSIPHVRCQLAGTLTSFSPAVHLSLRRMFTICGSLVAQFMESPLVHGTPIICTTPTKCCKQLPLRCAFMPQDCGLSQVTSMLVKVMLSRSTS